MASSTETVTVLVWSPSGRESSTPVSVTVCAVAQLPGVNVSVAGSTVTSPVSLLVTVNDTLPAGGASSTTVNVSVVPDSETAAVVLLSVKPATSLSWLITDTSLGSKFW